MKHSTRMVYGSEVEDIIYHGRGDIARHGRHEQRCTAALALQGEVYRCDFHPEHEGWPHNSEDAQACWQ